MFISPRRFLQFIPDRSTQSRLLLRTAKEAEIYGLHATRLATWKSIFICPNILLHFQYVQHGDLSTDTECSPRLLSTKKERIQEPDDGYDDDDPIRKLRENCFNARETPMGISPIVRRFLRSGRDLSHFGSSYLHETGDFFSDFMSFLARHVLHLVYTYVN